MLKESQQGCENRIKGLDPHRCGKPVADEVDGRAVCKRCAKALRRAKTMRANRRATEEEREGRVRAWRKRLDVAAEKLGIAADLDHLGPNQVERAVVSLEDFEALAERIPTLNSSRSSP